MKPLFFLHSQSFSSLYRIDGGVWFLPGFQRRLLLAGKVHVLPGFDRLSRLSLRESANGIGFLPGKSRKLSFAVRDPRSRLRQSLRHITLQHQSKIPDHARAVRPISGFRPGKAALLQIQRHSPGVAGEKSPVARIVKRSSVILVARCFLEK